jgi:hypothetical protein
MQTLNVKSKIKLLFHKKNKADGKNIHLRGEIIGLSTSCIEVG